MDKRITCIAVARFNFVKQDLFFLEVFRYLLHRFQLCIVPLSCPHFFCIFSLPQIE